MSAIDYRSCTLCPRKCRADRTSSVGFCGMSDKMLAARAMVHNYEEPCISGTRGSGAVFFSGCVLRCVYCQNASISHENFGIELSEKRLSEIFLELQSKGVHNINLVSGTQFYPSVLNALDIASEKLNIPVVWNSGGYENVDAIDRLKSRCSVFLQDIKYYSSELSLKYSRAEDYYFRAINAARRMLEATGGPKFNSDGILERGVVIRHLVLPSCRKDSIELLKNIKERLGTQNIILSLMSQYVPTNKTALYKELNRRLTSFEYQSVCDYALELGFEGYFQERDSASLSYTPIFDLSGL